VSPSVRMEVAMSVTVAMPPGLLFVRVAMSMVGWTEGDALKASMMGAVQTEPLPVSSSPSATGWTEAGAPEMSAGNVVVGQAFLACATHLSCHRIDRPRGGVAMGEANITWQQRVAILGFGSGR
jgi:hypothetical protein